MRNSQVVPQRAAFVKHKAAAVIVLAVGFFKVFQDAALELVDVF